MEDRDDARLLCSLQPQTETKDNAIVLARESNGHNALAMTNFRLNLEFSNISFAHPTCKDAPILKT